MKRNNFIYSMDYFGTLKLRKKIITLFLVVFSLSFSSQALAQTMSSSNYVIQSSTMNCGGGKSTSSSYALFDSTCEPAPGDSTNGVFSSSTNYVLGSGFQAMEDIPHLTVTFSDPDSNNGANTVAFGTLTTASVKTDQVGITVTTNATTGYSATLIANTAFRSTANTNNKINNVSDGAVTAGSPEYGFCTTGTDGQFACTTNETCIPYATAGSDTPTCTTVAKTFATNASWVSSQLTTLTFKAAISSITPAANDYTQTITVIVTGTF